MNKFRAYAGIRGASFEGRRLSGSLAILRQAKLSEDTFNADRVRVRQIGPKAWDGWRISSDQSLHDSIEQSLSIGKGLIIGGCFAGFYLPSLSLLSRHVTECLVMQAVSPGGPMSRELHREIEDRAGLSIKFVAVDPSSSTTLVRQLSRKKIAVLMLDMALPGMSTMNVPFLGANAITPEGLYRIAHYTDASILPIMPIRTPCGLSVCAGRLLNNAGSAASFAEQTLHELGRLIWMNPSQWWLWDHLYMRWAIAHRNRSQRRR